MKEKECVLVLLLHFKSQKLQQHSDKCVVEAKKKGIKFVQWGILREKMRDHIHKTFITV